VPAVLAIRVDVCLSNDVERLWSVDGRLEEIDGGGYVAADMAKEIK